MKLTLLITALLLSFNLSSQIQGEFVGQVKVTSLSGTGDRNVVADQNGVLKIDGSSKTKIISIPPAAFQPSVHYPNTEYQAGSSAWSSDMGTNLVAPISLPHNSIIKAVHFYSSDTDPSTSVFLGLNVYYHDIIANTTTISSPIILASQDDPLGVSSSNTTVTINNKRNMYFLNLSPDFGSTLNNNLALLKVVIEYE